MNVYFADGADTGSYIITANTKDETLQLLTREVSKRWYTYTTEKNVKEYYNISLMTDMQYNRPKSKIYKFIPSG